jgi:hypothetical protein
MNISQIFQNFIFSLIGTWVCLSFLLSFVGMSQFYSYETTFLITLVAGAFVALLQSVQAFFYESNRLHR